jgi:type IV secretion system protein TrbL
MSAVLYRRSTQERARGVRLLVWVFFLGSVFGLLFGNEAYAQTDQSTPTGATACVQGHCHTVSLFNDMDTKAANASSGWLTTITGIVTKTFWILAVIEICWAAAVWVYEKDSLNSLAVEVIKKIMFIGFFYAILLNAPTWIPTIVGSFAAVGQQAANAPNLSTDYIVASGLAICDAIMGSAPSLNIINVWGNIPKYIVAAFSCFGILICFVLMAAEYFCALMESYILFATGAVFLGLGSSTWTKDYVTKYLNYAIAVGVRLLIMMLCWALFSVMDAGDAIKWDYGSMLQQLGVAILKCMFFLKAPDMASALLNGGNGINHSAMTGAVGSAVNAANTVNQLAGGMGGGGLKGALSMPMKAATGMLAAPAAAAVAGMQGVRSFAKAAGAGKEIAEQSGKSGGAALLSGLGKAGSEVAKNMPRSMVNALKSAGGRHESASGPGPLKRASESLMEKAAAGRTAPAEAAAAAAAEAKEKASSEAAAANTKRIEKIEKGVESLVSAVEGLTRSTESESPPSGYTSSSTQTSTSASTSASTSMSESSTPPPSPALSTVSTASTTASDLSRSASTVSSMSRPPSRTSSLRSNADSVQ